MVDKTGAVDLLLVDDEKGMQETLEEIFKRDGYRVKVASTGKGALGDTAKKFYNIVVLDIKLPDMSGVEILKAVKKRSPDTEVVMITAYASLQTSITAINEGAYSYIMKPFEVENLRKTVARAVEKQRLMFENRRLKSFNENIVQSMNEGIAIEDKDGHIIFVNQRLLDMTGYSNKELLGKGLDSFMDQDQLEKIKKNRGSELKERRYEALIVAKTGKKLSVVISSVPFLENGRYDGTISVLTDISRIKSLDSELSEKVDELEKFNRLMVGRELRMVDLKNRIHELEENLKELQKKSPVLKK